MKKQQKSTLELFRENMIDTSSMQSNIASDTRIDTASRLVLEQQNIADYQQLLQESSKKEKAIKKIRAEYEQRMEKLLGTGGFSKFRRIASTPTHVVMDATNKSLAHESIAKETARLKEKKNKSYAAFLKKAGVSAKDISDVNKAYAAKIGRKVHPRNKPTTPPASGTAGGNPVPPVRKDYVCQ